MKKPQNTPAITPAPFSRTPLRLALGAVCLAALTACGGASTSGTVAPVQPVIPTPTGGTTPPVTTPITPTGPLTAAQERNAATALVSRYAPASQPAYASLSAVPTTGAAVYDGYFYGDLANRSDSITDSLIGEMQMRVAFDARSVAITGTVTGLSDADDKDVAGTLRLTDGALNRSGNPNSDATLSASVAGTLTDGAGRNLVVGVRLEGDFLGAKADGIGGEALGAVTVAGDSQDFDGGFIVER